MEQMEKEAMELGRKPGTPGPWMLREGWRGKEQLAASNATERLRKGPERPRSLHWLW